MASIAETYRRSQGRTVIICDFSPPRGGTPELLEPARGLDVDFVSVAYNPGKSTRLSSVVAAHWVKANAQRDVAFTLATRDMNKIAIQSLLLGAQLLGLENVVVVGGDPFTERDLSAVRDVGDYRPTELVRSIADMNQGLDFRGLKLRAPTSFCVGASIDVSRGIEREVHLTRRKVEAGTQFFLAQPTYDPAGPASFIAAYREQYGEGELPPIFHGVQVPAQDSISFGAVPRWVAGDLAKGRPGHDIALQILAEFTRAGFRSIYLVPPILRGGRRDYDAARAVLEGFKAISG